MTDQEQKNIFAKNLRSLLSESGKTQKEVADAIKVSPQTFNTWYKAIAIPRSGKIQALADYFRVYKSRLLDEQADSKNVAVILSPDESVFLRNYQKLNDLGRTKAQDAVSDLTEIPKYTEKDAESSTVAAG